MLTCGIAHDTLKSNSKYLSPKVGAVRVRLWDCPFAINPDIRKWYGACVITGYHVYLCTRDMADEPAG